ncbi:MAG: ATP-dependent RecD-like DNA helicase [Lachnospiraceae bacterium]
MDSIQGYVDHIIYHNPQNGYTVLSLEVDGEEEILVGTFQCIQEGEAISAQGEYVSHPQHGEQFAVQSYEIQEPEDYVGMERYLGSGAIAGIGPVLASRIMKRFKLDAFRIIEEEPERLAEIKGISERKARDIAVVFTEKQEMRQAMVYLAQHGIPTVYALRIYQQYGDDLYEILEKNPYQLADDVSGIGFRIADEIAGKIGIRRDSDFRIQAALQYVLNQASTWGHVYFPKEQLFQKTSQLLELEPSDYDNLLVQLAMDKKVIIKKLGEQEVVYSLSLYYKELNSARQILDLDLKEEVDFNRLDEMLAAFEKKQNIVCDEAQKKAVYACAEHGVVIITGGPGTGKTTIISALLDYSEQMGLDVCLAAPTGRAAKRMTETTGYPAQTIHRLLELCGNAEEGSRISFERNAMNPLETDLVIIDEASMVDISLFHALLDAIVPGTKLVLVGDSSQLPSVGPGNVLDDLIQSNCFTVVELSHVFRQAEQSDVVLNAHRIHAGESIRLDNKSKDFFFMRRGNVQDVIGVTISLVRDKMPAYVGAPTREIQVLTPMRKGELGVDNLNRVLQQYLNPPDKSKKEREVGKVILREGDKVMQIKNNYKVEWEMDIPGSYLKETGVGVFNGDIGVIERIDTFAEEVHILFDDEKRVRYRYSMLDELELAYAITVHKAQGSEYPAVVLPLLTGPQVLCNRNLLYTAITRAKKCVTIVGSEQMVQHMIENADELERYSSLDLRLQELKQGLFL